MTKQKNKPTLLSAPAVLEVRKTSSGAVLSVIGVVSVTELSCESISLASHAGRLDIRGSGLVLSVFENKGVEITGKIEGLEMGYGKHR